jgi:hypothetical protein
MRTLSWTLCSCLLLISSMVQAVAAQYEIVPWGSQHANDQDWHGALIVNTTTGSMLSCLSSANWNPPNALAGYCRRVTVTSGTMPVGPIAKSGFNAPQTAGWLGIWRVDQTNGAVTFCVSAHTALTTGAGPISWACVAIQGPW